MGQSMGKEGAKSLNKLMHPLRKKLDDIPGGTQNCTAGTAFLTVKALELNHLNSVVMECGSGAPLFALPLSFFTKRTICVDRPMVMDQVLRIISRLSGTDSELTATLQYVRADILDMTVKDFADIVGDSNILNEITHVTAFIGIDNVNHALVKFALKHLPSLEWLCFRGDLENKLIQLLNQFGYFKDENKGFTLTLMTSGI